MLTAFSRLKPNAQYVQRALSLLSNLLTYRLLVQTTNYMKSTLIILLEVTLKLTQSSKYNQFFNVMLPLSALKLY